MSKTKLSSDAFQAADDTANVKVRMKRGLEQKVVPSSSVQHFDGVKLKDRIQPSASYIRTV